MRKSAYGKEIVFLWEGLKKYNKIILNPTESTLAVSAELQEKIDAAWKRALASNPDVFDGLKWRTESVYEEGSNMVCDVSPITYSQHNVLRHIQGQPVSFYPNPLTINTVQETADGYILIGVRGKGSDQKGLAVLGAGFVDRYVNEDGSSKQPENLWQAVQRECLEETHYARTPGFDITHAVAMAVIFGSNHDTTFGFYLPLDVGSAEVKLGNNEYSDLIFLPNNPESLQQVLATGGHKGMPAADHLLGCLETYLSKKSAGQIKSAYQH